MAECAGNARSNYVRARPTGESGYPRSGGNVQCVFGGHRGRLFAPLLRIRGLVDALRCRLHDSLRTSAVKVVVRTLANRLLWSIGREEQSAGHNRLEHRSVANAV